MTKISPEEQVVRAWTIPGRSPIHHAATQNRLRREWPVLARALDRLTHEKAFPKPEEPDA